MSSGRLPGWAKVVVVVVSTLAVIYTVNLAELWLKNRRALAVEANLQAEVQRQLATIERIEAETVRAQTDAYAEEFARNERNWVLPGDHQIVPLPVDAAPTPDPRTDADRVNAPPEGDGPSLIQRVLKRLGGD